MSIDDTPNPLRIVIIGAGIAGLSAAIALSKQGHHVIVRIRPLMAMHEDTADT